MRLRVRFSLAIHVPVKAWIAALIRFFKK